MYGHVIAPRDDSLQTKVMIPSALRHLSANDCTEMGAAFAGNGDPGFTVDDEEFRQLLPRINDLTTTTSA